MKAISTIRRQIRRLQKVAEINAVDGNTRLIAQEAYESYHALRWVIEDVCWSPAKIAEQRLKTARKEVPREP